MLDPKKCSMLDCSMPLGPDALEFTHKGEPAGGICEHCLEGSHSIRVIFTLNNENLYEAVEMISIQSLS